MAETLFNLKAGKEYLCRTSAGPGYPVGSFKQHTMIVIRAEVDSARLYNSQNGFSIDLKPTSDVVSVDGDVITFN